MKKKILTLLALLLTAVTGAWADEVTIGENTNNTTSVTPTNSLWGYSFVEQIYTASEIGTSGTITSISFHQSSENGGNPSAVAIYMKHVNKETFGSTDDYETVSASERLRAILPAISTARIKIIPFFPFTLIVLFLTPIIWDHTLETSMSNKIEPTSRLTLGLAPSPSLPSRSLGTPT